MTVEYPPVQEHEKIAADDWEDQDLLTWSIAHERLVNEIARVEAEITEIERDQPGSPDISDHRTRLSALRERAAAAKRT